MRKILLRATVNPLSDHPYFEVLTNNYLGNNSGNLLFPFSIMKALMMEDVTIDTNNKYSYNDEEIEIINSEYDCYIVALANAFREDFIPNLKKLTASIRRIKIPCVVVGVGVQAAYEPDFSRGFPFDDAVKEFVAAVLDKSASIGVRGELTDAYLRKLGFSQSDVIGCPSMFLMGDSLPFREKKELSEELQVSVNASSGMPYQYLKLWEKAKKEFPNHWFVPQENKEMQLMYAGVPFPERFKGQKNLYPNDLARPLYAEDRVRFFTNVPSWLSFMQNMDFSFGTRIHGNIAAVLGGAPTFIFASDSRVRELASYHKIPYMHVGDIQDHTSISRIYEETDFSVVQKGHQERFRHYLDFLDHNGIKHISAEEWRDCRFEREAAAIRWREPLHTITSVSKEEQAERLTLFGKYMTDQVEHLKEENKKQKKCVQLENDLKKSREDVKKPDKEKNSQAENHQASLSLGKRLKNLFK
ncbi:MAG: polysaccharide pyruvyl transferase family protein [Eubacteriales bacterium]|nr:polysaccharide pyruvyl transferase family protein [Eubacteriales bacterium]